MRDVSIRQEENTLVIISRLKIGAKLFSMLVLFSAFNVAIFGYLIDRAAVAALRAEQFQKLTAVRELNAHLIEHYFDMMADLIVMFSESRTAIDAIRALKPAYASLEVEEGRAQPALEQSGSVLLRTYYQDEFLPRLKLHIPPGAEKSLLDSVDLVPERQGAVRLQEAYIASNPHPIDAKRRLVDGRDGSSYSAVHRKFHPIFRSFLDRFGFYDIFLVDVDTGVILYSVSKEADFATSLLSGPYRDSNLAQAYREARDAEDANFFRFVDFEPYWPSYGSPAAFVASPIFDGSTKIGVLVFQIPINGINSIMSGHHSWRTMGMGNSGETYLVGEDLLMRSQSRFLAEWRTDYLEMIRSSGMPETAIRQIEEMNSTVGLQRVDTHGTRAALAGAAETGAFSSYRGGRVLASYRPLSLPDVRWAIISEIDESEALGSMKLLRERMLHTVVVLILSILLISSIFSRTMTRPLKALTATSKSLARGDLSVPIDTRGQDEYSQLARSFDVMRVELRNLIEDLEQRVEDRAGEVRRREREFRMLADNVPALFAYVGPDLRYRFVDKSYEDFFQMPAEQIIGKPVAELMGDEAWSKIRPSVEASLSGEKVEYEVELSAPGGPGRWFKASYVPNFEGERVDGIFVLVLDITQRKQAEEELKANQDDLRRLSSELSLASERERQRIASELHDELGQILTMCQNELDRIDLHGQSARTKRSAERLRELLDRAVTDTRQLTFELSSPLLHSIGLEAAVEQLCLDFEEEYGIAFAFRSDGQESPMSDANRVVFFRAVRELLMNIVKHAKASRADCHLTCDGDFVRAEVHDDGAGFNAAQAGRGPSARGGFGLFHIREYFHHAGGRLEIESSPIAGTRVSLEMPTATRVEA